jgi:hypothetical protein
MEFARMFTVLISDVQSRAQRALADSPFFELRELQVDQRESILYISGSVSSFYQKQLAQEVVRTVCEGIEVINSIRVKIGE